MEKTQNKYEAKKLGALRHMSAHHEYVIASMMGEMGSGKKKVSNYGKSSSCMTILTECLKLETWFRLAEVDIVMPEPLWSKFEEMSRLFYSQHVPDESVTQHIKDYLKHAGKNW